MMDSYASLLATLVALLAGLAIGKAWERYKLKDGRWIDRRRARDSPHYMLGLNFLVANQVDPAIEELTKAAHGAGDPLEIHLILGNLYREKGQVGRAIQEHQALLQRPDLRKLEHANVLLCLGLDYKRGGFVDRALEAFTQVLRLDPDNQYALTNLEKLYEEQHQWTEAYATRQKLAEHAAVDAAARHKGVLAFLENEIGLAALKRSDHTEAARRFDAAIELDSGNAPAHLNLGDVRASRGDLPGAVRAWEQLVGQVPERAYLAFERLEKAYAKTGAGARFAALCRRLIAANSQDWRARLALARHLASSDASTAALDPSTDGTADAPGRVFDPTKDHGSTTPRWAGGPLELLFEAIEINPHALALHQAIWQTLSELHLPQALVDRYVDLTRDSIFYLDPHICVRCRYRSTELLWTCPHCHEWNTFVEERIAPAKDTDARLTT